MAYTEGQLNGSGDYRVGLNVYYTSQDWAGNYSVFFWEVTLVNANNSPSWINSPSYWSANIAGEGFGGSFALPSSGPFGTRSLGSGYKAVGHDGAGYRPGFGNTAIIDTPHSNIGDGSTTTYVDAPRIPQPPSAPGAPYLYSFFNGTSARIILPSSSDDGGATIDMYLVRMSENPNVEAGPYTDLGLSPSQLFGDFHNLKPGTTYYMYGYVHNARGWVRGPLGSITTQAGMYVSDGAVWRPQGMYVSDGSAWQTMNPKINDGDSYENPMIVTPT